MPTPTPKPTPTPTPTPVSTPTPEPSASTQTTPELGPEASLDITPEQIDADDLSVGSVTTKPSWKSSEISWMTSLPDVVSAIEVGTTKDKLEPGGDVTKQEDGTSLVTLLNLQAGTRYYYIITATSESDSAKKATYSGAFTTRGYPVTLQLTQESKPLPGAKVTIDKGVYTSDKMGAVVLELADKPYSATITDKDNTSKKVSFTVAEKTIPSNGDNPQMQKFSFSIAKQSTNIGEGTPIALIVGSAIAGLALIGGFLLFLLYRRRRNEQFAMPTTVSDGYAWAETPSTAAMPISSDPIEYDAPVETTQYTQLDSNAPQYTPDPEQLIDSYSSVYEQPAVIESQSYTAQYDTPVETPQQVTTPYNQSVVDEDVVNSPEISSPYESEPIAITPIDDTVQTEWSATTPSSEVPLPIAADDDQETLPLQPAQPGAIYDPTTGELAIIHHDKSVRKESV